jgi:(p)ppGpp synthase/HD superfamily hydrolase
MGLGANCLHDVVEDSQITAKQMSGILKPEVAMIVDALAKRPVEEFCSREDCEDEYYGHLLTLVAINPRIALVNLFD